MNQDIISRIDPSHQKRLSDQMNIQYQTLVNDFIKSMDSKQRVQFQNEYAGRYFGREEDLMAEVAEHSLKLVHLKKFQEQEGWPRLLAIFVKSN